MRLHLPHCPHCGAVLTVPPGAARVDCGFCGVQLRVEPDRVTAPAQPARPEATAEEKGPPFAEPEAVLRTVESPSIELSVLEQRVEGAPKALWRGLDLPQGRFALLELRTTDDEGHPVAGPLAALEEAVTQSLADDGDPGLAASVALELLPAAMKLELGIAVVNPSDMTVLGYRAGVRDGWWWSSHDEGRSIQLDSNRPPLERRMLREARDHFSNASPIQLAAGDALLFLSAGALGRGDTERYPVGVRPLLDVANAQLGEHPLRLVTLIKNAFWEAKAESNWQRTTRPIGDVVVAAVRARARELVTTLPSGLRSVVHATGRFEVAQLLGESMHAELIPLTDDRAVVVTLTAERGAAGGQAFRRAAEAVRAVLNTEASSDSEDAVLAREKGLEAAGAGHELTVVLLGEEHGVCRYALPRGRNALTCPDRANQSTHQPVGQGGNAWLRDGGRLFLPSQLVLPLRTHDLAGLATSWPAGKCSRLYEALRFHWKSRSTERALQKTAFAVLTDSPGCDAAGIGLVTLTR